MSQNELSMAIQNYFTAKYHNNTGYFKDAASKQTACDAIHAAAKSIGAGSEIAPGLVVLHFDDGWRIFDKKNQFRGGKFFSKKDTNNPVGDFLSMRTKQQKNSQIPKCCH